MISIVIPTYNCAEFLPLAIDSVLNQAFQDFEIIVIDDGSVDSTQEILRRYDGRVRYEYQNNAGLAVARNRGIDLARGDVIAFLDADDLWDQRKLELQYEILLRNNRIDAVFCDYENFTEKSRERPYFDQIRLCDGLKLESLFPWGFFVNDPAFFERIVRSHVILPSTFMVRRRCLERVGVFEPSLRIVQDTHLWLRMVAADCQFAFVPEALVQRRLRGDSLITDEPNFVHEHIMMYHDLMRRRPPLSEDQRKVIHDVVDHHWYNHAYRLLRSGVLPFERNYFRKAMFRDRRLSTVGFFLSALLPDFVVGTAKTCRWRWRQFWTKNIPA